MSPPRILPADRPGCFELFLDGRPQSYVDLTDPTRLVYDYVRRIGEIFDEAAPARKPLCVLHIGGGALTVARYVAATRPRSSQIVLEPASELVSAVREQLPLPPRSGIKVREIDGRIGLLTVRKEWADVVVLDAFADGRAPADLVSVEAFGLVHRALAPGGIAIANLVDKAPHAHTRRVIAGLYAAFVEPELALLAEQSVIRGRRQGNLIVIAGAGLPKIPVPPAYTLLRGGKVRDSFGGGRAFTDADAEPGPAPEPSR